MPVCAFAVIFAGFPRRFSGRAFLESETAGSHLQKLPMGNHIQVNLLITPRNLRPVELRFFFHSFER